MVMRRPTFGSRTDVICEDCGHRWVSTAAYLRDARELDLNHWESTGQIRALVFEPLRPGECGAIGPDLSHCDAREHHSGNHAWNCVYL